MASTAIITMIKDYLHITYTPDESGERRLAGMADDGIAYIQRYCDPAATCEPGTQYAAMLCEYVLRADSGALDTFGADYAQDILAGRLLTEVAAYAEEKGYVETDETDDETISDVP